MACVHRVANLIKMTEHELLRCQSLLHSTFSPLGPATLNSPVSSPLIFFFILFFSSDFFVTSLPLIDSLFIIYSFKAGIVCCEPDTTPGLGVRRMKKIIMVPHRSVKYNTAQSLILFLSNYALWPAVPHILVTLMAPVHILCMIFSKLPTSVSTCQLCVLHTLQMPNLHLSQAKLIYLIHALYTPDPCHPKISVLIKTTTNHPSNTR